MAHAQNWKYIVVTGGGEVSGTDDADEAQEVAADCTVLKLDYDAKTVVQIDSDGDSLPIGSL